MTSFETRRLSATPDVIAPDGSEIRLLSVERAGASMAHCTLNRGAVTRPIFHRTVEEAWFCVAGEGRLWRSIEGLDETIKLEPGIGISIAVGMRFQFRNDGSLPLEIVIATFPPWPGNGEAAGCEGVWAPTV
ncbi:MAG: cupin domain-containing protein [Chloroflexi bacterium]|nr:cupin domain-containing protein [Chloroflexota bacterium]